MSNLQTLTCTFATTHQPSKQTFQNDSLFLLLALQAAKISTISLATFSCPGVQSLDLLTSLWTDWAGHSSCARHRHTAVNHCLLNQLLLYRLSNVTVSLNAALGKCYHRTHYIGSVQTKLKFSSQDSLLHNMNYLDETGMNGRVSRVSDLMTSSPFSLAGHDYMKSYDVTTLTYETFVGNTPTHPTHPHNTKQLWVRVRDTPAGVFPHLCRRGGTTHGPHTSGSTGYYRASTSYQCRSARNGGHSVSRPWRASSRRRGTTPRNNVATKFLSLDFNRVRNVRESSSRGALGSAKRRRGGIVGEKGRREREVDFDLDQDTEAFLCLAITVTLQQKRWWFEDVTRERQDMTNLVASFNIGDFIGIVRKLPKSNVIVEKPADSEQSVTTKLKRASSVMWTVAKYRIIFNIGDFIGIVRKLPKTNVKVEKPADAEQSVPTKLKRASSESGRKLPKTNVKVEKPADAEQSVPTKLKRASSETWTVAKYRIIFNIGDFIGIVRKLPKTNVKVEKPADAEQSVPTKLKRASSVMWTVAKYRIIASWRVLTLTLLFCSKALEV
ncbi:hypothetical protein J6590_037458 [Homalodisca vitripennis]|nr:hypothetical protein J6590_037458 [Homalodisca vitripennis]